MEQYSSSGVVMFLNRVYSRVVENGLCSVYDHVQNLHFVELSEIRAE